MTETRKAEAEAVVEALAKNMEPTIVSIDDGNGPKQVLLAPTTMVLHDVKKLLAHYRSAPERREGTADLTDLASFIAHVNRFKDEDSALFADVEDEPHLLAVYDYHRKGPDGAPRFGKHRAIYKFPISTEWETWTGHSGVSKNQTDFCAFIEDHLADVADPAAAGESCKAFASLFGCGFASASRLLELSRGLSVNVGARVQNHQNLSSGETRVSFVSEHTDPTGKQINVPGAFLLALPILRNGVRYQVPARLRYRVNGAAITWSYELHRPELSFDHAIGEACGKAQEKTELPIFMGAPE